MMVPTFPERSAFRSMGIIFVPGAVIATALMPIVDASADSALLQSWVHPKDVASAVVWLLCITLIGLIWSAALNYVEMVWLDVDRTPMKVEDLTRALVDESDDPKWKTLHTAVELYDEVWVRYVSRIEEHKNRHLSSLVNSFHWEWNVGSALAVGGLLGLFNSPRIASAAGLSAFEDKNSIVCGCWFALVVGVILFRMAEWTHHGIADLRTRIVFAREADRITAAPSRSGGALTKAAESRGASHVAGEDPEASNGTRSPVA